MGIRLKGQYKNWPRLYFRHLEPTYIPPVNPSPPVWETNTGYIGTFAELQSISIPLLTSDPDNDVDTYEVIDGELPGGVTLNLMTGVISGTLAEVTDDTTYTFKVKVTDKTGLSIQASFSLIVANVATTVTWETPSGELLDIAPGEPSTIKLEATSK